MGHSQQQTILGKFYIILNLPSQFSPRMKKCSNKITSHHRTELIIIIIIKNNVCIHLNNLAVLLIVTGHQNQVTFSSKARFCVIIAFGQQMSISHSYLECLCRQLGCEELFPVYKKLHTSKWALHYCICILEFDHQFRPFIIQTTKIVPS